jgi:hypothetical protein
MITSTTTRLAGKALGDFLKVAMLTGSEVAERRVLGALTNSREFVDAPGIAGKIASLAGRNPETVAKLAGAAAPALAAGGIAAGAGLISEMYGQSQYALPLRGQGSQVSFANQQYIPGVSPMTNQSVAKSMLDQQRFQHQLQLINARQSAQEGVGIAGRTTGDGLDIMGLSKQVFAPVQY